MTSSTSSNLRKAAVLLRSMDADTAATLLAQLSPAEAAALRGAIRALGSVDSEEQADVLAEFRHAGKVAAEPSARGVELAISAHETQTELAAAQQSVPRTTNGKRFAFLEEAPIERLAAYLAREHAQTIAVVLSHLAPSRAAQALAALPAKVQADTVERLATLGDTDPESVVVLERELAAWVARRTENRQEIARRRQGMVAILAAADSTTRSSIMANLKCHKAALAEQIAPDLKRGDQQASALRRKAREALAHAAPRAPFAQASSSQHATASSIPASGGRIAEPRPPISRATRQSLPGKQAPAPTIEFEHLIHLDERMLNDVLRQVDSNALALALAGSSDALVDRVCQQMPKRAAKAFRRELRRLGPTRLSDVETAQREVARIAAQQLAQRKKSSPARNQ